MRWPRLFSAIFVTFPIAVSAADFDGRTCRPSVSEQRFSPNSFEFSTTSRVEAHALGSDGRAIRTFVYCVFNHHRTSAMTVWWPLVNSSHEWVSNSRPMIRSHPVVLIPDTPQQTDTLIMDSCLMYGNAGQSLLTKLALPSRHFERWRALRSQLGWCDALLTRNGIGLKPAPEDGSIPRERRGAIEGVKIVQPFQLFFPLDPNRPSPDLIMLSGVISTVSAQNAQGETSFLSQISYGLESESHGSWQAVDMLSLAERFGFSARFDERSGRSGPVPEKKFGGRIVPLQQRGDLDFESIVTGDVEIRPYLAHLRLIDLRDGKELLSMPFYFHDVLN